MLISLNLMKCIRLTDSLMEGYLKLLYQNNDNNDDLPTETAKGTFDFFFLIYVFLTTCQIEIFSYS